MTEVEGKQGMETHETRPRLFNPTEMLQAAVLDVATAERVIVPFERVREWWCGEWRGGESESAYNQFI